MNKERRVIKDFTHIKDVIEEIKRDMKSTFIQPDSYNNKVHKDKDVRVQDKRNSKDSRR